MANTPRRSSAERRGPTGKRSTPSQRGRQASPHGGPGKGQSAYAKYAHVQFAAQHAAEAAKTRNPHDKDS